jgi:Xaa-Pro aminopeptidase
MNQLDSATQEMSLLPPALMRRDDVDLKQIILARLLADSECEGLLLLEPANFRWFTSGSLPSGAIAPDEAPGLFVNPLQRWILCCNTDTQRFFDEELDGLGFQVKEWHWSVSREQHVTDLCFARKIACDRPFRQCKQINSFIAQERRRLTRFEEEQTRLLGRIVAHALEATARNIELGDTEAEIAGHLAHRLLRHGAEPAVIQVAADDRARDYRRPGVSGEPVQNRCLLQATATRGGLFVTASRTVAFRTPDTQVRLEFDAAARLSAYWTATAKIGDSAATLLEAQQQLFAGTAFEHEWRLSAPGWWTGREPCEESFSPKGSGKLTDGNALVLRAQIGGCVVTDTFILRSGRWTPITPVEDWPYRRYTMQGAKFDRPDLLIRDSGTGT